MFENINKNFNEEDYKNIYKEQKNYCFDCIWENLTKEDEKRHKNLCFRTKKKQNYNDNLHKLWLILARIIGDKNQK